MIFHNNFSQLCFPSIFQGPITCVTSNKIGNIIVSGGKDGKICMWQWGHDHFPHEVIYDFYKYPRAVMLYIKEIQENSLLHHL